MIHGRSNKEIFIGSKKVKVDARLALTVSLLNRCGFKTLGCCSGHGKYRQTIIITHEGSKPFDIMSGVMIPRKKRFYKKDKQGYYYIPEVEKCESL